MARARNIKPGFFKNEDLAECTPWARLCFAGLWTLADREGRLEDRAKRIKGELFAYDSVEVEPLLQELTRFHFIVRYEVDGQRFIQVSKFQEHQTPHYTEKASAIPGPELQESHKHDDRNDSKKTPGVKAPSRGGRYPLIPDSLIPDSLNPSNAPSDDGATDSPDSDESAAPHPVGDELPGIPPPPPKVSAPNPPPAFDGNNAEALNGKSVVPIAAGWELPEQWGIDAESLGWKPGEVLREAEKFRQYWTAGKGTGTRRSVKGWRQTWSNWLDKAAKDRR